MRVTKSATRLGGVLLVFLFTAGSAMGGILQSDPNGMAGWQGVQPFRSLMNILSVNIEYCVYETGTDFAASWGVDPTGGSGDYVYAYQIFNDLDPHPSPLMQGSLSSFSVKIDGNEQIGVVSALGGSGVSPSSASQTATVVVWDFLNPTLNYPSVSDVLYFTSPFGPEAAFGAVSGSGLADQQPLPSAAPEPATIGMLALGAFFICGRRRWKEIGKEE